MQEERFLRVLTGATKVLLITDIDRTMSSRSPKKLLFVQNAGVCPSVLGTVPLIPYEHFFPPQNLFKLKNKMALLS